MIVEIQQSGGLLGGRRRRTATTIFRKAKNEARQHPGISAKSHPRGGFFFGIGGVEGFDSQNPTVRGTVGRSPQAHRNHYFSQSEK
ncbi:MAG: hypothetical protein J6B40_06585 [Oscillospiraceae bacterium]|nr:hypothetical protein [Oscillospiraceae bacterium]